MHMAIKIIFTVVVAVVMMVSAWAVADAIMIPKCWNWTNLFAPLYWLVIGALDIWLLWFM